MSREVISIGIAANDKKGDTAIVFGAKVEDALEELYLFLSGNNSTVTLPTSGLPVSKGGTGSITIQGARSNLGILTDTNNQFVLGGSATKLYDEYLVNSASAKPFTMKKTSPNIYTIYGASYHGLNGFTYVLPRDELGNLLCTCTIEFDEELETATVKVYGVLFNPTTGKYEVDTSMPIPVPDGRCIDISLR